MGVFKRWRKNKDGSKSAFWYYRFSVNGKDKWKSAGKAGPTTKAMAQAKLAEKKRQIRLGLLDMIDADVPTLIEFSKEYLSYVKETIAKRSWRRDEISISHLVRFFGESKLSSITPKDILDYQSKRLSDGKRPATINRELACLKHLFNYAKQRGNFFGENPVSNVKFLEENNQLERILSLEEEERLLSASAPHLRPIILTAVHTGMRKNELLLLKWSNIDFESNIITVEATNTKNRKKKRIPINSSLRKLLLEQKLKTGFSPYIFLNPEGKAYLGTFSLTTCFENACGRAGIKGLRFHDLRHTAATRMIEAGASIVAVSKILGHSNLAMTMRYSHPDNSLKEAVEKLANFKHNCSQNCSQEEINK